MNCPDPPTPQGLACLASRWNTSPAAPRRGETVKFWPQSSGWDRQDFVQPCTFRALLPSTAVRGGAAQEDLMTTHHVTSRHQMNWAVQRANAVVAGVIVAGALALAACLPAAPAAKPNLDVRIGLIPNVGIAQILVPTDEGEFAARGLNVSIQPVTDTTQTMISVAGGQFDIGGVSMGPATLNAFNRGADLKIIASVFAEPPGHGSLFPVIVRTELIDSGAVKTVADLKGRKVALNGRGTGIEYTLAKALATGYLSPADVEIVTMPFPEMLAALSTGAIDAAIINQPTAARAVAQRIGKVLVDDYNPNAQGAVLVANTRFLEQHRDEVTSFLEVYVQAIRRLRNGKLKSDEQALAILQKYTNIPPDVISLAPDPYWPMDARVNLDSLREQQAFYLNNNSVGYTQAMDIDKLIDYGPLDAALTRVGG
jgi:NitT/TauT family transport system substrate-binding protein